jgi:hypothetical protein
MRLLTVLVVLSCCGAVPALAQTQGSLCLADFESGSAWAAGSGDKGGTGHTTIVGEPRHGGRKALRFAYDFANAPGTAFIYARVFPNLALPGQPQSVSVWVKGDGSGRNFSVRYQDAQGESYQRGLGRLDFDDWRELRFPVSAQGANFWGGPEGATKGKLELPVRLTEFIVDKSLETGPNSGAIYLDDLSVVTLLDASEACEVTIEAEPMVVARAAVPLSLRATVVARNRTGDAKDGTLTWRLVDWREERLLSGSQKLTLAAQESRRIPMPMVPLAQTQGYFEWRVVFETGDLRFRATAPVRIVRPSRQTALNAASPIGINGHLASPAEMQMMQRAGIKWMRADWLWSACQPTAGDFRWEALDSRYKSAREHGISLLPILCYGVDWASTRPEGASGDASRYIPKMDAWLAYVRAVVDRYKEGIHYWEVWNEPNISFWLSSFEDYVTLLKATAQAIRETDPTAKVLMGGTAGAPVGYIDKLYQAGCKDYFDIVNIHPYQYPRMPDDGMAKAVRAVWECMNRYGDARKPIWVTEVGYPNHTGDTGVSLRTQADYLARTYISLLGAGVERVFWYDYQNGTDPAYNEHNFGIVFADNRPKPCYFALQTVSDLVGDAKFLDQPSVPPNVGCYRFRKPDGRDLLCLWALHGRAQVFLTAKNPVRVFDLMGNSRVAMPAELGALELDTSPLFLLTTPAPTLAGVAPLQVKASSDSILPTTPVSLTVSMANPSSVAMTGTLDVLLPHGWSVGKFAKDVSLKPGEQRTLALEVSTDGSVTYGPQKLSVMLSGWAGKDRVRQAEAVSLDVRPPWKVQFAPGHRNGQAVIAARVTNLLNRPLRASAFWTAPGFLMAGRSDGGPRWETFAPGKAVTVEAPEVWTRYATVAPYWNLQLKVETFDMPPAVFEGRFSTALALRETPGLLSAPVDCTIVEALPMNCKEQVQQMTDWRGEADLSALALALWSDKDLVLRIRVRDDRVYQPFSGGDTWQGDSVQLAIDPTYRHTPDAPHAEYDVALTSTGPQVFRRTSPLAQPAPSAATATIEPAPDGTQYTIRIPWTELGVTPAPGGLLGLGIVVNDNDGAGRRGWIEWGGGIGWTKDPSQYLDLSLAD